MRRELAAVGAILVPNLLTEIHLRWLEEIFGSALDNPGPRATHFVGVNGYELVTDHHNSSVVVQLLEFVKSLALGRLIASLWKSEHVWFLGEELFLKTGGETQLSARDSRTNWHQDTSFVAGAGPHLINVWISLEEVPVENALEIVRGSHHGIQYAVPFSAYSEGDGRCTSDEERPPDMPDIEADRITNSSAWDVISWRTQMGDALLFHGGTLHGGAPVTPSLPSRRTLVLRFFGDYFFYRPLPASQWRTSPNIAPGLGNNPSYVAGDVFRPTCFIQVW